MRDRLLARAGLASLYASLARKASDDLAQVGGLSTIPDPFRVLLVLLAAPVGPSERCTRPLLAASRGDAKMAPPSC